MDTAMDNPSYFAMNQGLRKIVPLVDRQRMGWNKTETGSMGRTRKTDRSGNKCLTRSFSANVEETRLLVMGQPRPADVAPSVKHTKHTSSGHKDSLQHDLVHCNLQPDGNVFFSSSGDVRYSNLKSPLQSGRRHSISSFGNYSTRRPLSDCMAKSSRARLSSGGDPKGMKSDSPDIVIISSGDSEAAMMWINFLIQCFQHFNQKENKAQYRIQRVRLEDVLSGVMSAPRQERCSQARLQIVLVCPIFLERVLAHSGRSDSLCALLQTNRMLALLVGVTENDLTDQHKTVLVDYDEWRKMVVKDQDRESVGDFYGVSMDILNNVTHAPRSLGITEEDTKFSITPKKIKVGQNKVIVLLSEPLIPEDNVVITVDKNGHKIEVTNVTKRNPYTLQFRMPLSCLQVSVLVNIIVEKNGQLLGRRSVKCESRMRELDQLLRSLDSPLNFLCQTFGLHPADKEQLDSFLASAYLKNVPPNFHLLQCVGSRPQYSHEEYPTMLHFAAKFGLEKLMWQLLDSPGGEQACQIRNVSQMTPVDMAEASNHQKLAQALKGHMQMTELTSMYSILKGISDGHHQSQHAAQQSQQPQEPPQQSQDLQQSQQSCNDEPDTASYGMPPPPPPDSSYVVPQSPGPEPRPLDANYLTPRSQDANYLMPQPLDDNYLIPPAPRPVEPTTSTPNYTNVKSSPTNLAMFNYQVPPPPQSFFSANYQVPTNGRPYSPGSNWYSGSPPSVPSSPVDGPGPHGGYLEMSSNIGSYNQLRGIASFADPVSGKMAQRPTDLPIHGSRGSNQTLSTPQDELLEIINDFKNEVLTINEVESIVEMWKNRHEVKQSFKEKQEQLDQMRAEYDQIQQRMKDTLKRPTPFERIRKFFSKNKSKQSGYSNENLTRAMSSEKQSLRPSSSISLQSSSSSTSCSQSSTVSTNSANDNNTFHLENLNDDKLSKSSSSYFDAQPSFSTFFQSRSPVEFAGHEYGNVVYSPLGMTSAAETIMEETEAQQHRPSQALGVSTIRCMAGIACSVAALPSPTSDGGRGDGNLRETISSDPVEEQQQHPVEPGLFGFTGTGTKTVAEGPQCFDEVEDKVQQLFDSMPHYTNVPTATPDQNRVKYTPLRTA
uniref:Phosphoinositide 3-kinase adapter protein 1 n=1 Tax=Sipha flava TaxID=143950 RepID=A0A2S2R4D6_9HEMI